MSEICDYLRAWFCGYWSFCGLSSHRQISSSVYCILPEKFILYVLVHTKCIEIFYQLLFILLVEIVFTKPYLCICRLAQH